MQPLAACLISPRAADGSPAQWQTAAAAAFGLAAYHHNDAKCAIVTHDMAWTPNCQLDKFSFKFEKA
jgi:hypothetical protein